MQLFEQWVFDKQPTVCQVAFYALGESWEQDRTHQAHNLVSHSHEYSLIKHLLGASEEGREPWPREHGHRHPDCDG